MKTGGSDGHSDGGNFGARKEELAAAARRLRHRAAAEEAMSLLFKAPFLARAAIGETELKRGITTEGGLEEEEVECGPSEGLS